MALLQPESAEAHANLASCYKDAARQDAAITSYRRALALRPDFPEAFANLVHSLQCVCEWRDRPALFQRMEVEVGLLSSYPAKNSLVLSWDQSLQHVLILPAEDPETVELGTTHMWKEMCFHLHGLLHCMSQVNYSWIMAVLALIVTDGCVSFEQFAFGPPLLSF